MWNAAEDRRPVSRGQSAFAHALPREAPSGGVDLASFRAGMKALAGAVTVLTTVHEGRRWGLTATAVCSLSAEPPRLLACVNQRGASFAAFAASRRLAVNVLAEGQFAIAESFAGQGSPGTRFASGVWRAGDHEGLPLLEGAVSTFECRIAEMIDALSHAILIGDIMAARTNPEAQPLLYCDGRFTAPADPFFDPRYGHQF
jgi:flavin reductase (DIM6/NTAB) family NADH-FMN oxidoreductase RutF